MSNPAPFTPPIGGVPAPRTVVTEPMLGQNFGPTPAKPPAGGYDPTLPFIVPQARDRWLSVLVRGYTPELVENILRGAFAGNLLYQWQLFDLMEQTWPHLQKSLNELKRAVKSMELSVVPFSARGQKPTAEAEERAALVEAAISGMHGRPDKDENGDHGTRYDVLDAWGKGISVLEIDWEVRQTVIAVAARNDEPRMDADGRGSGDGSVLLAPNDPRAVYDPAGPVAGKEGEDASGETPDAATGTVAVPRPPKVLTKTVTALLPRDTRWVHPWNYGYPAIGSDLMLDTTRINSQINPVPVVYQPLAPYVAQFAPFPPNKFIISICKQKSGHPIGGAMLRCLAWWWCAANFTQEWLLNYAQIFGQPFRWAEYDQTKPGLLGLIEAMMENMGSFGWAAFPAGTKLNFLEGGKSASDNPQAYVLRFADQICDIVVLGQTLSTDVGQGGAGSRALGQVHAGIRGDILEAAGDHVANVLTQQLARFVLILNYGNAEMLPTLVLSSEAPEDAKAMADRDDVLAGMGLPMGLKWLYERHDIPPPQDGEAILVVAKPLLPPGPGYSGPKPGGGGGGDSEAGLTPDTRKGPTQASPPRHQDTKEVAAKDASEKLADQVLEDLTGVEAKWLGGVKPFFTRLIVAAQSGKVTDQEFIDTLKHARGQFPELFNKLDTKALQDHFFKSGCTAVVNGVAAGIMKRGAGSIGRKKAQRAQTGGAV